MRLGSSWYVFGATLYKLMRDEFPEESRIEVMAKGGGIGNPIMVDTGLADIGLSNVCTAVWARALAAGTRQAAEVAVPIAAIGIIIDICVQSNLTLEFSAELADLSGASLPGALVLVIFACIVMGMGLPTVAAYIIGASLFVPALIGLGVGSLPAHFFVMYYCVLSMVTPPVALASYTAAGLAGADQPRRVSAESGGVLRAIRLRLRTRVARSRSVVASRACVGGPASRDCLLGRRT